MADRPPLKDFNVPVKPDARMPNSGTVWEITAPSGTAAEQIAKRIAKSRNLKFAAIGKAVEKKP